MGAEVVANNVYCYPFQQVVSGYLSKYPTPLEKNVTAVTTVEEQIDPATGIVYRRRIATCNNIIPSFLRKSREWIFQVYILVLLGLWSILKVPNIYLEEESWLDMKARVMNLKTRCLTWVQYASMNEESVYRESKHNCNWTEFSQKGTIKITGAGYLNCVLEKFAQTFLKQGAKKSIAVMEKILEEKYGSPVS
ncbi:PRELI domain-containing protein 2 isoform 2-T2 [Anomaloglossus baeobatrachus]|uniref:PRELI domain-containing protein 2 isoform X2 n=1 Tax=Anomaloglossus baeobatrachus TaxID=238106 RepID=UPI003F4F7300